MALHLLHVSTTAIVASYHSKLGRNLSHPRPRMDVGQTIDMVLPPAEEEKFSKATVNSQR
jgi:hypothetical protein